MGATKWKQEPSLDHTRPEQTEQLLLLRIQALTPSDNLRRNHARLGKLRLGDSLVRMVRDHVTHFVSYNRRELILVSRDV